MPDFIDNRILGQLLSPEFFRCSDAHRAAAMAMWAASAAALRGIFPEASIREANSATSGVMSIKRKPPQGLQPFTCSDQIPRADFVDDELGEV
jgi:hypothetical protein